LLELKELRIEQRRVHIAPFQLMLQAPLRVLQQGLLRVWQVPSQVRNLPASTKSFCTT
jgi:hypothetical protein